MTDQHCERRGARTLVSALVLHASPALASMGAFVLVGRALGPSAYADYVFGLAIVSFLSCFSQNSIKEPILQAASLSIGGLKSAYRASVHWVFLLSTLGMSAAAAAWWMMPERAVFSVVGLLSCKLLVDGMFAVPMAVRAKRLDFGLQSSASALGSATMFGSTLFLLAADAGISSLAIAQLLSSVIQVIVIAIGGGFRNFSLRASEGPPRVLLRNSVHIMGWQVIEYLNSTADRLVSSYTMTSAALGAYGFGRRLNDIFFEVVGGTIGSLTLPKVAAVQGEPLRVREVLERAIGLCGVTIVPLLALLFCLADAIIVGLFGEKWVNSVSVYRCFLFLGLLQTFGYVQAAVVRGMGAARLWTAYVLAQACANIAVIALFARFDGVLLAVAVVIKTYCVWFLFLRPVCRLAAIPVLRYCRLILMPVLVASCAGAVVWFSVPTLMALGSLGFYLVSFVEFALVFLVLTFAFNRAAFFGLVRGLRASILRG